MLEIIDEACETVQAVAAGKSKALIRQMLTAELRSRGVDLPPPLVIDGRVEQIAAGTFEAGKPIGSMRYSGLFRLPFFRKHMERVIGAPCEEFIRELAAGGPALHGVARVTEHVAGSWPMVAGMFPYPPGRDLYAPAPKEAPPKARLILDADLRERLPQLLKQPFVPKRSGLPSLTGADWVLVWLEADNSTVAACCEAGRIGILDSDDAGAYLPLVRAAQAQGKVVAAAADVPLTPRDSHPVTIRVISDDSDRDKLPGKAYIPA